ncbi:hypothetical protein ATJ97_3677 [Georgenia soli]|uniref:Uncharacterized protein n=1 Tax=Georgenia soli TaxID=638953 RepID=A0A2A9ESF0_9MICO|nr:hypothetical protein [Georgenia soli]PFG41129.1 hypothetical protein ATJ97_3677 [Georgenia soli]
MDAPTPEQQRNPARPANHGPVFAAIAVVTSVLSFVFVVAGTRADQPGSGADVPGPVWYLAAALTVAAGVVASWWLLFPGGWWVRPAKVIAALAVLALIAGILL